MYKNRVIRQVNWLFVFLWIGTALYAQPGRKSTDNIRGIHLGAHTGVSMLINEVSSDFSQITTEFRNQPGPHLNWEVSKCFGKGMEVGVELTLSWIKGETGQPGFSATGWHPSLPEQIYEPVEYNNRLYGPGWFVRYHILNFESPQSHTCTSVFIKAGSGLLMYESELFRIGPNGNEFIFGKGYGKNKTTKMANAVYRLGGGMTRDLSSRLKLMVTVNFNMVNYDFLDVVHNYDTQGNRVQMIGVFSDFSAGLSYRLEKSMVPFMRKVKKRGLPDNLPFYRRK